MDHRILIAVVVGLVLVAFGGFYFALGPHPASRSCRRPCRRASDAVQRRRAARRRAAAAPPPLATAESIEAEIALSDHAELQALLKETFAAEYSD